METTITSQGTIYTLINGVVVRYRSSPELRVNMSISVSEILAFTRSVENWREMDFATQRREG